MKLDNNQIYVLENIRNGNFVGKSHIEVTDSNNTQLVFLIDSLEKHGYIVLENGTEDNYGMGAKIIKGLTKKGKQALL